MSSDINEIELRRLDLNLLLVFSAVMQSGSVKAAAGRLFMGPSAVSIALARLRHVVGEPLFYRVGSGLKPTQTAEALYVRLRPALAAIGDALADRRAFEPSSSTDTFNIGMLDDFEWWLVPILQRRLSAIAPSVTIAVHAIRLENLRSALESGQVDLVVTANPGSRAGALPNKHFFDEDFVVLAPASSPMTQLSLDDYLGLPHALVSATGEPRGAIDLELESMGLQRRVSIRVQHFVTLPFLILDGGLIATMPRAAANVLAERFNLNLLDLPFLSPKFGVGMIWHDRTEFYPPSTWLRNQIVEAMRFRPGSRHDSAGPSTIDARRAPAR